MPLLTPTKPTPKPGSLIVCAGTVTCSKVDDMSSGFRLFKSTFLENQSCEHDNGWKLTLQGSLNSFHDDEKPMPAYMRIAREAKHNYIGGVATVPSLTHNKGLNPTADASEKAYKAQYKSAVQYAILDAKKLNRPLFLQPLGIGVYGWDPRVAAKLFADAIMEYDPTNEVDITIPIYNASTDSADSNFKKALASEMAKRGRPVGEQKVPVTVSKSVPNESNIHTATSNDESTENKARLCGIIATLVKNIEKPTGKRWTSGTDSNKVNLLKTLSTQIFAEQRELTSESDLFSTYVNSIKNLCEIKRNPIHFWATPESVDECMILLCNTPKAKK